MSAPIDLDALERIPTADCCRAHEALPALVRTVRAAQALQTAMDEGNWIGEPSDRLREALAPFAAPAAPPKETP